MWAFIYQTAIILLHYLGRIAACKTILLKLFHPIHVSTTNIEYNKQDNKLEVICTIFTDDFEAALAKQYHTKTDLNKHDMHAAMDALIKSYIADQFAILKPDDVPVKLKLPRF